MPLLLDEAHPFRRSLAEIPSRLQLDEENAARIGTWGESGLGDVWGCWVSFRSNDPLPLPRGARSTYHILSLLFWLVPGPFGGSFLQACMSRAKKQHEAAFIAVTFVLI